MLNEHFCAILQAKYRPRPTNSRFVYPYNVGKWRNFRNVCHMGKREDLDGTWWPVREGCDQFTFTVSTTIKNTKTCTVPLLSRNFLPICLHAT